MMDNIKSGMEPLEAIEKASGKNMVDLTRLRKSNRSKKRIR